MAPTAPSKTAAAARTHFLKTISQAQKPTRRSILSETQKLLSFRHPEFMSHVPFVTSFISRLILSRADTRGAEGGGAVYKYDRRQITILSSFVFGLLTRVDVLT